MHGDTQSKATERKEKREEKREKFGPYMHVRHR